MVLGVGAGALRGPEVMKLQPGLRWPHAEDFSFSCRRAMGRSIISLKSELKEAIRQKAWSERPNYREMSLPFACIV